MMDLDPKQVKNVQTQAIISNRKTYASVQQNS
jgi:hypothetical protein